MDSSSGTLKQKLESAEVRIAELEEKLRQSEERRRILFANLPQRVFFKNVDSRFEVVNETFASEVNSSPDDLIGKSDYDLYPSELARKYQADDRRIMSARHAETLVEEHVVQGEQRIVEVTKAPVIYDDGQVIGLLGVFTDITDRVRSQSMLQHERDLLHALMDNIPDSIYFKDIQSRFIRINMALADRFGLSEAENAEGKTDFDFFAAEHAQAALADEQRVIATSEPMVGVEEREVFSDGRFKWVSTTKMPLRNEQGQTIGTFGVSRDISKSKMAEHQLQKSASELAMANGELRASEKRYRILTEGTQDAIVTLDEARRITLFNAAAEQVFLYSSDEILAHPIEELIPRSWSENAGFHRRLDGDNLQFPPGTHELVGQRKGGQVFPIDISLNVLRDAESNMVLAAIRDATARKQIQSRLVQVEKISALGLMSAGMAHEINNPIAFVANNLAVLERDVSALTELIQLQSGGRDVVREQLPGLAEDIQELEDRIDLPYTVSNMSRLLSSTRNGVKRVADIVQNLKSFSRVDRAAIDRLDVHQAIDSSVEIIQTQLSNASVAIHRQYGAIPTVVCAPAQINQVILNLLINAMQAIQSASADGPSITIQTTHEQDAVIIRVIDNGPGIPSEVLPRIFDPFFTTKPVGEGTGLGLSIIHGIVSDHRGSIEVESTGSGGTCFRVELPVAGKSESD